MKKTLLTLALLFFVLLSPYAQQPSEQDLDNQISQARNDVQSAQNAVDNANQSAQQKAQQLQQLKSDWNAKEQSIKAIQDQVAAVDNTIAKSVEHIDQEIQRAQNKLANLKKNNADQAEIDQAQREITANTNLKNSEVRRNSLNATKAALQKSLKDNQAALDKMRGQLQGAIDSTKIMEDQAYNASLQLADVQQKLADLLQKAPDLLNYIAPPYLKRVSAQGESGGTYQAEWDDYSKVIDEQIEIVKRGIGEQKSQIESYKKLIDVTSDKLMEQQHIADEKLDAYVNEVKSWSWVKSSLADMLDATLNIARNFKEMGPYAFAYEAVYRIAEPMVTGQSNDWDIMKLPNQPHAPVDITSIGSNIGVAVLKDQVKGLILQALQSYISTSPFGIPGEGLHYGTESSIKGVATGFRELVSQGKFWVVADEALGSKWMARVTDPHFKGTMLEEIFATLKRDPKAFLSNWASSFNKERLKGALLDLAQSSAIQALKEFLDQKRLNLWSDYLVEDQKRSEMLNALKIFGAMRGRQLTILQALNDVLQDLIRQKEEQANKPTRYLKIIKNDVISGSTCNITLEFSAPVQMDSVVLQGITVKGSVNKNVFNGTADMKDMKDEYLAQLTAAAKGPTTQKIIDDPITTAQFAGTSQTWQGYEPKNDTYHRLKLRSFHAGTSVVLLVDCSGSMGDNHKMDRAIKAAESVLNSKIFGQYDEISLMAFYDCGGAQVLQPFTNDYDLLKQRLKSLYPSGGTPLAASMLQASKYLESAAHNRFRKLIVLTDGEESCQGNEFDALQSIQQFHQDLDKRLY